MPDRIYTVAEVAEHARSVLRRDSILSDVTIAGEISGYKLQYPSGHRYFQLKDPNSAISCVMFRMDGFKLSFEPTNGMKVLIHGHVDLYTRDGRFQIYVDDIRKQGVGDLYAQFEELKKALEKEGLFDPSRKRPLPAYPSVIGIVTSASGAALRDMVRIARRRNPNIGIILSPCAVQGNGAAKEIAAAIERLNKDGRAEVILCGRGGGSMEDLWCFNEEITARAIAASRIPVVSCVGHETDFTISDFTADKRAATPSMAAEITVPVASEQREQLQETAKRISFALAQGNNIRRASLRAVCMNRVFRAPADVLIARRSEMLDRASDACQQQMSTFLREARHGFDQLCGRLSALNPESVLERGYACVSDGEHIVMSAAELKNKKQFTVRFRDGSIIAENVEI